jgi:hypothetical protein
MDTFIHAAFDTEASQHDLSVRPKISFSIPNNAAAYINKSDLRLKHVKLVRRPNSKANIAFKISWPKVVTFLTRSMLWEVLGSPHNKLSLVSGAGHSRRIDALLEIPIHS